VIAIIGMLVGLLLPAVQSARESARRSGCSNNLKQLGIAMQNYVGAYGALPSGMGPSGCCWGTWAMLILPFLEESQVADRYINWGGNDTTVANLGTASYTGTRYSSAPNTTNVTTKRFPALTCVSDQPNAPLSGMTSHNYAANFGSTGYAQQANLNGVVFGGAPFAVATDASRPRFGRELSSIRDGTGTTLLAAEVLQGQAGDLRGFIWWGDACEFTTYLAPNSPLPDRIYTSGYCTNLPDRNLPCDVSGGTTPTMFAARSRHPRVVQVVMCDSGTRVIEEDIDLTVWRSLSTTQGREVVSVP
jgi:type II secretory pathway pseudopilin PulG